MSKKILVTGGAGYIGSHTSLALLEAGYEVVVLDNFSNSSLAAVSRVESITSKKIHLVIGDVRDPSSLDDVFARHHIHAVLHFAGLKSVTESVENPVAYYENNFLGTLFLCKAMKRANVFRLIFSSSATVYGEPREIPVSEQCALGNPENPYGRSKLMAEQMLQDMLISDPSWHIAALRYFNPVGAHSSGLIGENPNGVPNNLVPYISQVGIGKIDFLRVFGNDYATVDGTGVRDYIHVQDLAAGHLKAISAIENKSGLHVWNLGTGRGYSVLEVVHAFEEASGKKISYKFFPRRAGDIAECWADTSKANKELEWKAERGLSEMMRDVWRWQSKNPQGYSDSTFASLN